LQETATKETAASNADSVNAESALPVNNDHALEVTQNGEVNSDLGMHLDKLNLKNDDTAG